MWDIIKGVFGFQGVGESALRIVDRMAGTDWTPKDKIEWYIKVQEATKHQSVARRTIAILIVMYWFILGMTWLVASIIGRFCYDTVLNPGTTLASDVSAFMDLNVTNPVNVVIGFYFATQVLSNFKKG